MKRFILEIGEVKTFTEPVTFVCFGLGSCVGLFMQDRVTGIAGGAHILLPDEDAGPDSKARGYNVSEAIDCILTDFKRNGSKLLGLRAKIAGGANVLSYHSGLGSQNVQSVISKLIERRIYIAASDVGGRLSRTAQFDSNTGMMLVRMLESNTYKIY